MKKSLTKPRSRHIFILDEEQNAFIGGFLWITISDLKNLILVINKKEEVELDLVLEEKQQAEKQNV